MKPSKPYWILAALIVGGLAMPRGAAAQWAAGQKDIGVHVGLSGVGSATAIGLNGEYGYNKNIGIGAWLDTWSYGYNSGLYGWNVRYIALAATGAYHFPIKSTPKLDPFVGLALGYYIVSTSVNGTAAIAYNGSSSRLFLGAFGGLRYYFNNTLSGVARAGFGASYLTLGLDFKLPGAKTASSGK